MGRLLVAFALVGVASTAQAQERGAAALASAVRGLGVSARVLVIGAHPDDEDTQVITWLSRGRHVETAYLSLTRGDGGQNLLGNELGEALGAIRTEELLAARRIDGAGQYFTRAFDFGFSKTADETFTQWPHDSLLRDVITVVRAFKPHVIISVFTGTPRDGHGHHQAAGILAREAFDLAADTVRFPRAATAANGPWTPLKFYRGASFRPEAATLSINVGEFDPVLGRSYAEIAAISRSQHKSQAFGSLERKGVRLSYLQREASRVQAPEDAKQERSMFDGIDTTWARFAGAMSTASARAALDSLPSAFAAVERGVDVFAPETSVPGLVAVASLLHRICEGPGGGLAAACRSEVADGELGVAASTARRRVEEALQFATGTAVEATASRELMAAGEPFAVQVVAYNRGRVPMQVQSVSAQIGAMTEVSDLRADLAPDSSRTVNVNGTLASATQPWWLQTPRIGASFTPEVRGVAEADERRLPAKVTVSFSVQGAVFGVTVPVTYRYADALRGELNKPVAAAPAISVALDRDAEYAPANAPIERQVRVHVTSASGAPREVDVSLRLPSGLVVDSASRHVTLPGPGSTRTVAFNVRGRLPVGRHAIQATATSGGQSYAMGYGVVDYDHIRAQRLYRPATISLEAVDVKGPASLRVGYIAGVGDNSAPMLEQLGLAVTTLSPADLPGADLSKFNVIVVGTRAYEASPVLVANNAVLLNYVKAGGTMLVQYGQYEMQQPGIMPYPITLSRPAERVTVENAPYKVIDPSSPVLNGPNKIGESDFAGWLQDRSLYMPTTFDPHYRPVLEMNDPGEKPNRGAVLVTQFGKGTYIYTTLAFFRQLPNGVPGAARLFVNLLLTRATNVVQ